jgi:hypothetical protein
MCLPRHVLCSRVLSQWSGLQQLVISNSTFCCFYAYARQICSLRSRDNSQYSEWLWLHDRGVGVQVSVAKNFLFSMSSRLVLGPAQPRTQWIPGAFSLEVKQPGCEADHSPQTSAEVKKIWTYISAPLYAFMA